MAVTRHVGPKIWANWKHRHIKADLCILRGRDFTKSPLAPSLTEDKDKAEIRYPDECWNCGSCRIECPENAIAYMFP